MSLAIMTAQPDGLHDDTQEQLCFGHTRHGPKNRVGILENMAKNGKIVLISVYLMKAREQKRH